MANTSWLKQADQPLFPDLLWSRPENRTQAGKLLIVGGRVESFAAPAKAYAAASEAGIGTARVILPEASRKMLGKLVPEAEFAPSNAAGSFGRLALASWLDASQWADGVLLAGDFGNNSETLLTLESFVDKFDGLLSAVGETAEQAISHNSLLVVLDFSQLQKLAQKLKLTAALTSTMSLHNFVEMLAEWTTSSSLQIVTAHQGSSVVACGGRVSTTAFAKPVDWVSLAAYVSVWHIQNPTKPFEALTIAVWSYLDNNKSL